MDNRTIGNNIVAKINNTVINYDDVGNGSTTLMFIHGFPFDKTLWKPQVDLFKNIYRVIAYDLRGFGRSIINDQELTISLFADDLIVLMDELKIDKAVVCGLSMGGYVLLNALSRYPERFKAVILSDTQCQADTVAQQEKRYESAQKIKDDGLLYFTRDFIEKIFYADTFTDKKIIVDEIASIIQNTSAITIIRTLDALAKRTETCSYLNKITIPALIIAGKDDKAIPIAQSEYLHKNIKGAIFHPIEKAGHLPNLEQPDEFNKVLSSFIADVIVK